MNNKLMPNFFTAFIVSLAVSFCLVPAVKFLALKLKILDFPGGRKLHSQAVPLSGGVAIFIAFFAIIAYFWRVGGLFGDFIRPIHIIGIFASSLVLMIGGFLDDKYNLKARYQIIFPVLASLIVIFCGVSIHHVRNPFGGIINFDIFSAIILGREIFFPGGIITFFWFLGIMYTTKILDGLDGLVSGISAIGTFVIFFICLLPFVRQFDTAFIAIVFSGAICGFLPWNFHPAKIFLGEGGSLFLGFIVATLAIISGSKVATTLLVLGVPVFDVAWIIFRRVFWEKKSFAFDDRKHLHFRLLDIGFSHRHAVLVFYLLAGLFGGVSVFLQTKEKAVALLILAILMVVLAVGVVKLYRQNN